MFATRRKDRPASARPERTWRSPRWAERLLFDKHQEPLTVERDGIFTKRKRNVQPPAKIDRDPWGGQQDQTNCRRGAGPPRSAEDPVLLCDECPNLLRAL